MAESKPILSSDSPIERAVLWEAEQVKERIKKAYAILSEPLTMEKAKESVTTEDVSQAANIISGFIPGVPDNALKALLTMQPRVGKVLKVQKKEDFAKIFNEAIQKLGGNKLSEKEAKEFAEHALGAELKGIRGINMESLAKTVQKELPVNSSVLDRLIAISKEVKKVSRHERSHTATLPIVRFTTNLQITPDSELDTAAQAVKYAYNDLNKWMYRDANIGSSIGLQNTELYRMLGGVKGRIGGNLYGEAPYFVPAEAINNLWEVYNSRGGRKIMEKFTVGKRAMQYFDSLATTPYKSVAKVAEQSGSQELKYLPNMLKVPPAGTKPVKEVLKAKHGAEGSGINSNWYTRSGRKIMGSRPAEIHAEIVGNIEKATKAGGYFEKSAVVRGLERGWIRESSYDLESGFIVNSRKNATETISRLSKIIDSKLNKNPKLYNSKLYVEAIDPGGEAVELIYDGTFGGFTPTMRILARKKIKDMTRGK